MTYDAIVNISLKHQSFVFMIFTQNLFFFLRGLLPAMENLLLATGSPLLATGIPLATAVATAMGVLQSL